MKYVFLIALLGCIACKQQSYIVVRHGEKAAVQAGASKAEASDPPLSAEGNVRASKLAELMSNKRIGYIFSTPYKRTISTVTPLSERIGVPVVKYAAQTDSMDAFISRVKALKGKNILIAGHSNTIDDLANKLAEKKVVDGDLPETEYDNIFLIKRKGGKLKFSRIKY